MKKKLLIAAAVTALTAATAVPALALENEFHGAFTTFYDLSNFSGSGVIQDDAPTENYFVQRFRLNYNAKASDNVKLVSRFEFDFNFWGNSSYNVARGAGGAIGADSVQMETKNIYLDLTYPLVNAKIGMMANNDAFKGLLYDADMAGIQLGHNYDNASVSAGFFRFNSDALGRDSNDMFALEAKYNVNKTVKVGAGYYYITDDRSNASTIERPVAAPTTGPDPAIIGQLPDGSPVFAPGTFIEVAQPNNSAKVHTVGINVEGTVGPVAVNALAMRQFGDLSDTVDAKGYAFNVGAKVPLAGGTLRSEFLYVSGGDNAWFLPSGAGGTEGGQFYDAEMTMLGRNKFATAIDNAIIYDVNNFGEGVIMGTVGYDYTFSEKLSASANVGFAAIADEVAGARAGVARGTSDYLGTEVNAESYYNLTSNVTLGARAGYLFLGDYFADSSDNIYDVKVVARYNF